jgi:transcriptional regulator of acetoin/glycerol metabolism
MALLSPGKRLTIQDVPEEILSESSSERTYKQRQPLSYGELKQMKKEIKNEAYADLEIRFLENALNRYNWNISKTAEAVGIDRRLLQNMIKKHGIKRRRN